jgi:death-on-curing protein
VWLSRVVVDAVHNDQVREHGGAPGVRDENVLESALARAQQKWHDADHTDVPALAAAYAFGLVKNHPYRDGNKRIGFLAMVTFLGVNGYDFSATDAEVVAEILALADGTVSEEALADWIRQHSYRCR